MEKIALLFFLLCFPGFIAILRETLALIQLWQVKEYRLDRVVSHLRFEKDYRKIGTLLFVFKIALLALGLVYLNFPQAGILSFAYVIIFVLYFFHLEWFVKELLTGRLVRPKVKSKRNLLIFLFNLVLVLAVFAFVFSGFSQVNTTDVDFTVTPPANIGEIFEVFEPVELEGVVVMPLFTAIAGVSLVTVLILDLIMPISTGLFVALTAPLSWFSRKRTIQKARGLVKNRDDLKVVAITGSYGKTTTKEMTAKILGEKYQVAFTPANRNTAVGIAQSLLSEVKDETEVFVAEMGAYKLGEIRGATKILPLDVAVVTALTQQHLSLFGSEDKLFKAKFELVEGLKPDGVAVLNGNDEKCLAMAGKTKNKKAFFYQLRHNETIDGKSVKHSIQEDANENVYLKSVREDKNDIELEVVYQSQNYKFAVKLASEKFVLNLAAAMTVCLQLGMSIDEVIAVVKKQDFQSQAFEELRGINNSKIVYDGKTSNSVGFHLALEHLARTKAENKAVMTQGIIELGKKRRAVYAELAKAIVKTADMLITSDRELAKAVKSVKINFKIVFVKEPFGFINAYKFNINEDDCVLVEGAFSDNVLNQIIVNEQ